MPPSTKLPSSPDPSTPERNTILSTRTASEKGYPFFSVSSETKCSTSIEKTLENIKMQKIKMIFFIFIPPPLSHKLNKI
jgi:hypothetical protein